MSITNPVMTADAEYNALDGYDYRVLLIPGDYSVAFTREDAHDMDPTDGGLHFLGTTHDGHGRGQRRHHGYRFLTTLGSQAFCITGIA